MTFESVLTTDKLTVAICKMIFSIEVLQFGSSETQVVSGEGGSVGGALTGSLTGGSTGSFVCGFFGCSFGCGSFGCGSFFCWANPELKIGI